MIYNWEPGVILYGPRDPTREDIRMGYTLWFNVKSDELFVRLPDGWAKITYEKYI